MGLSLRERKKEKSPHRWGVSAMTWHKCERRRVQFCRRCERIRSDVQCVPLRRSPFPLPFTPTSKSGLVTNAPPLHARTIHTRARVDTQNVYHIIFILFKVCQASVLLCQVIKPAMFNGTLFCAKVYQLIHVNCQLAAGV